MKRAVAGAASLAAVAIFLSGGALAADTVVLIQRDRGENEKRQGRVTVDDAEKVVLKVRIGVSESAVEYRRDQVKEVIYDDGRLGEYQLARRYYEGGEYDQALANLQAAMEQPHHELLTQYLLYYTGLCHQELGETERAIDAFEKLRAQGDKTRFLFDASMSLLELHADRRDYEAAEDMLSQLRKRKNLSRWDEIKLLIMQGALQEKQGRHGSALRIYQKATEQARGPSAAPLAAQSRLAAARCLVSLKRYDEAERSLRQVVRGSHSNEVCAEAYLLLGDSLKARAKTKDDYEKCLLDGYLRVPLLYGGDEKTEARALYEAGRCFQRMAGEENRARADTLFAQLTSKYPGSEYAKKVR